MSGNKKGDHLMAAHYSPYWKPCLSTIYYLLLDICVFSQGLMGSNWKEYIREAKRVLRYNGEMIISESVNRYDVIKAYIEEEGLHIKKSENNGGEDRWFYMYILND